MRICGIPTAVALHLQIVKVQTGAGNACHGSVAFIALRVLAVFQHAVFKNTVSEKVIEVFQVGFAASFGTVKVLISVG